MADAPIVVIADDLSGAAELAGIAFAHGLAAEVQTQWHSATGAQVIALDTDTRSLPVQEAAARVHAIAQQVAAVQPRLIFKKVDSVLRGNVRPEIEAILSATGQSRAVIAPANPSRGRVIRAGRYLINGVPLHQTEFASDPDHPRLSAEIATLLGGPSDRISIPDISTSVDLERIARSLDDSTLAAGAADFFAAILARHGHAPCDSPPTELPLSAPALLVCGSFAAWTNRKSECEAANLPVLQPNDAGLAGNAAVVLLRAHGTLVLVLGDVAAPKEQRDQEFTRFTTVAADLIRRCQPATILVEGGATAAALAHHLAWTRLAVAFTVPAGIGALRPLDASNAPLVLLKPGSYAWPSAIWQRFISLRL